MSHWYTRFLNAHTNITGVQNILLHVPIRSHLNCINTHYTIVEVIFHGRFNVCKLLIDKSGMFHEWLLDLYFWEESYGRNACLIVRHWHMYADTFISSVIWHSIGITSVIHLRQTCFVCYCCFLWWNVICVKGNVYLTVRIDT
jgi:hypothetical protein